MQIAIPLVHNLHHHTPFYIRLYYLCQRLWTLLSDMRLTEQQQLILLFLCHKETQLVLLPQYTLYKVENCHLVLSISNHQCLQSLVCMIKYV